MKRLAALFLTLTVLAIVGCSSLSDNVFRAEQLATQTAKDAVHSFNVYYHGATNGMDPNELRKMNVKKDSVYAASRNLSSALLGVDDLRIQYETNKTVKAQLQGGLAVIEANSSNIVWLVNNAMKK